MPKKKIRLDLFPTGKKMSDLIYIIGYADIDLKKESDYKVGKSTERNLSNRLSGIQVGSPRAFKVYATFPVDDPQLEKRCHYALAHHGMGEIKTRQGEWFNGKLKTIKEVIIETLRTNKREIDNNSNPHYLKLLDDFANAKKKCDAAEESFSLSFIRLHRLLHDTIDHYVFLKEEQKGLKKVGEELKVYDEKKFRFTRHDSNIKEDVEGFMDWLKLLYKMSDKRNIDIDNHRLQNPHPQLKSHESYKRIDICCLDDCGGEVYKYYPKDGDVTWDTPPSKWTPYERDNEIVGCATKNFNSRIDQKMRDEPEFTLEIDENFREEKEEGPSEDQ